MKKLNEVGIHIILKKNKWSNKVKKLNELGAHVVLQENKMSNYVKKEQCKHKELVVFSIVNNGVEIELDQCTACEQIFKHEDKNNNRLIVNSSIEDYDFDF